MEGNYITVITTTMQANMEGLTGICIFAYSHKKGLLKPDSYIGYNDLRHYNNAFYTNKNDSSIGDDLSSMDCNGTLLGNNYIL